MLLQSAMRNRILARLSPEDFERLVDDLEPLQCDLGTVLSEPDETMPFVYFLESGVASVVAQSADGQAEAGIIGREGFIHPSVILGSDQIPSRVLMQIADDAHRIPCPRFVEIVAANTTLRQTLLRFAHVYAVQANYNTLSNAIYKIAERLARWLLMCHDRSQSDELALTHEFLGVMLSVRRPSVTNALHVLEGHRLVGSERGYVTIRNRAGLETFAGDAYGKPETEYRRLLGPL